MIYVADSFTVHFDRRSDEFLMILFNPMHWRDKSEPYWGYNVCKKNGYSVLAFRSSSENWYPSKEIIAALPSLSGILDGYSQIITYGHSMGGYAALKYARLFRATRSIAFSPQASIDPRDVGKFDQRYAVHYKNEWHESMLISPLDLPKSAYVVYDPNFSADSMNVKLFSTPAVKEIRLYNTSHSTIIALAKSGKFPEVIQSVLADSDPLEIKKLINPMRKYAPAYFSSLSGKALRKGRSDRALSIATRGLLVAPNDIELVRKKAMALSGDGKLKAAFELIENMNQPAVLDQAGNLLMQMGRLHEAVHYFERAVNLKAEVLYFRHLASAHELLGNTDLVEFYLERAIGINPQDSHVRAQLGAFYLKQKMYDQAKILVESAIRINGKSSYFYHLLSLILEAQTELLLATLVAERSVQLGGAKHIARLEVLKKKILI